MNQWPLPKDGRADELVAAVDGLATTRWHSPEEWAATVLPFALPMALWSAPSDWSPTERSRAIRLEP